MNCCDYGCAQGRNCPVRYSCAVERLRPSKLERLVAWLGWWF